jgi:hypothetical protein
VSVLRGTDRNAMIPAVPWRAAVGGGQQLGGGADAMYEELLALDERSVRRGCTKADIENLPTHVWRGYHALFGSG